MKELVALFSQILEENLLYSEISGCQLEHVKFSDKQNDSGNKNNTRFVWI